MPLHFLADRKKKRKNEKTKQVLEDVKEAGARELSTVSTFHSTPEFARETVEASCKYMNYMDRQVKEMEGWRRNQEFRIPDDMEYTHDVLPSLSSEELEKLGRARPETFAAASQMQGITPHSLVYLYNHVTRKGKVRIRTSARVRVIRALACVCALHGHRLLIKSG